MIQEIDMWIEKMLCKFNFHRLTWENGETGHVHCYCDEAVENKGRIAGFIHQMYDEAQEEYESNR